MMAEKRVSVTDINSSNFTYLNPAKPFSTAGERIIVADLSSIPSAKIPMYNFLKFEAGDKVPLYLYWGLSKATSLVIGELSSLEYQGGILSGTLKLTAHHCAMVQQTSEVTGLAIRTRALFNYTIPEHRCTKILGFVLNADYKTHY